MEAFDDASRRYADPRTRSIAWEADTWKKPPQGMMKINWDAAVDKERGTIRMGVIIWDPLGEAIAMHSGPKAFINNPSLAEAMAARTAIELSISLGLRNCILEGDALEVINAINQTEPCRGTYRQIVNDIKLSLLQGGHWQVSHARRAANGAAHLLAKMALHLSVS